MKEDHIEKDVPEVEVETIFSVYPSAENISLLKKTEKQKNRNFIYFQ